MKRVVQGATSATPRGGLFLVEPATPWKRRNATEVTQAVIDANPDAVLKDDSGKIWRNTFRWNKDDNDSITKRYAQGWKDAKKPKGYKDQVGAMPEGARVAGDYIVRKGHRLQYLPADRAYAREYLLHEKAARQKHEMDRRHKQRFAAMGGIGTFGEGAKLEPEE